MGISAPGSCEPSSASWAHQRRGRPRYREGTLIEAMQNAWRFVEVEPLRERLREAKGIGTPATRAEIIAGLKRQGFLVAQGKHIVPTERGLALFEVLRRAEPALVDPGVTAELERQLDDVLTGRQEMMGAIDAVCDSARRIIGTLAARSYDQTPLPGAGTAADGDRPPTAAMKKFAASLARSKGNQAPSGLHSFSGGMPVVPRRTRAPAESMARHQATRRRRGNA